jgi:hypothetical protein
MRVQVIVDCANVIANPKAGQKAKDVVKVLIARGFCTNDGVLFRSTLTLDRGASAYEALAATGLPMTVRNTSMGHYIAAISGLQEMDGGPQSGWIYLVNGTMPGVGADGFTLSHGDQMRWRYTIAKGDALSNLP